MRRSFALLVISGLLPLVALSGFIGTTTLRGQRKTIEGQAHAHAQFAATLIADRLADGEREVRAIAKFPVRDAASGEPAFRMFASQILRDEPGWRAISIADADGYRLIDVPAPIGGATGGRVVDMESLRRAVTTGRPAIGRVMAEPRGTFAFAIRVPVLRAGGPPYVVSAVVPASSLRDLILFQPLPDDWRAGVVDGEDRLVATSRALSPNIGLAVSPEARLARATGVQGLYHFTRRDGVASAGVFVPVAGTDWTVHVSVPESYFSGPARTAVLLLVGATILCLLLFAILARLLLVELREHRAREDAVVQAQRMEALGRLTGGVAHDFNNLLTPIVGGLDLLKRRSADDPKSLRYIDAAMASAERARTLVGRLLAFSRRQTLAPRDVDVAQLIAGLSDLIDRSLTPAVGVDIRIADGLPSVLVDPSQLELAILNLAINARDAMPNGGTVTIAAHGAGEEERRGLPPGRYVAVTVSDTGMGMDDATLSQATDPFFTTKAADKGTGLGLSMVHGFAAQSGGALQLASKVGVGTKATIVLPEGAPIVEEAFISGPQPAKAMSVLLVDDDEAVRSSTAEMLRQGGHQVREAGGVEEALAFLARKPEVDVVVTDYLMPGRSGADLIRALRQDADPLPVLLITGYINTSGDVPLDVPKLAKPYRSEELLLALAAVLPA